ncbi:MAG: hypothetical protein JNL08_08925 [Planctomycetes bacterium]|nr:hypothetical protein [Planctomycetota bacterium]
MSAALRAPARQFQGTFDRARLFRTTNLPGGREETHMPGRVLFGAGVTIDTLRERLLAGDRIRATKLTEQFGPEQYAATWPLPALPLFVVGPDRKLEVVTAEQPPQLRVGATVLTLAPAAKAEA